MCSTDIVDIFMMEITNKIAFQSKADFDLESMSFILKLDRAILKMYLLNEKYYLAAFTGGNKIFQTYALKSHKYLPPVTLTYDIYSVSQKTALTFFGLKLKSTDEFS